MYIPIGNDMAVREKEILGIFDMDNTTTSGRTRAFLRQAEKDGGVVPCDELPKTFVLTVQYGMQKLYLSSLNSRTLEKRISAK